MSAGDARRTRLTGSPALIDTLENKIIGGNKTSRRTSVGLGESYSLLYITRFERGFVERPLGMFKSSGTLRGQRNSISQSASTFVEGNNIGCAADTHVLLVDPSIGPFSKQAYSFCFLRETLTPIPTLLKETVAEWQPGSSFFVPDTWERHEPRPRGLRPNETENHIHFLKQIGGLRIIQIPLKSLHTATRLDCFGLSKVDLILAAIIPAGNSVQ